MVVFILNHLYRKTIDYNVNQKKKKKRKDEEEGKKETFMQLNHGNLSIHLPGKVLTKQVNFVFGHLHSNCVGSKCPSAWKSFFFFQSYSLDKD